MRNDVKGFWYWSAVYAQLNDTHLTEVLAEREGIEVSRETVRRLRRESGQGRSGGAERPSIGSVGSGWLRREVWCFGTGVPMPGLARNIPMLFDGGDG